MVARFHIEVQGIVQGVGFRPFVYGLAKRHNLAGHVWNDAAGVSIEVEGEDEALQEFLCSVREQPPPLALVERIACHRMETCGEAAFVIESSHACAPKQTFVSPDVCVCDDCLRELNDPADRRYRYPFISCANCGPRFTLSRDLPYDRPATTKAALPLCDACRREYEDSAGRRFHAQSNTCPRCGPQIAWQAATEGSVGLASGEAALLAAARALASGQIVAVKGLGGYLLACDARRDDAVKELRGRKRCFEKPFALMVTDVAAARAWCAVSEAEAKLLSSRRRPIVLLEKRAASHAGAPGFAADVAPCEKSLGVMLPYTPLQVLLMAAFEAEQGAGNGSAALVLTSGNVQGEPIIFRDEDAMKRLAPLADGFLIHDRLIQMRCDDSVTRMVAGRQVMLRRARGYAPEPICAPQAFVRPILAVGAQRGNTFCLGKGHHAFVSHHIGDVENFATLTSFSEGIEHFQGLFDVEPTVFAHDLHPDYLTTKYALERADWEVLRQRTWAEAAGEENEPKTKWRTIGVQHHHAHIAAVTGEHCVAAPVIGVAFDGSGYGIDGTLWGGEFLVADWRGFRRAAHLQTVPLLGGERAIQQIWRLGAAWLQRAYGDDFLQLDLEFVDRLDRSKWRALSQMEEREVNSPRSSAMGRLFDAVAAIAGLRDEVSYEAQAAMEWEMLADESCQERYPFQVCVGRNQGLPDVLEMTATLRALVSDLMRGEPLGLVSARFHNTVAAATAQICTSIRARRPSLHLAQVALGGGVFQNALLLRRTLEALDGAGFAVLTPVKLPFNDGAIAFGQAVVANSQLIGT